ncbi:MAG TPA: acetyl-CoA carboxylase biotin carboxyl carrier protein subunit [Candidatus Sulfopaludibacter sp.]|jgi:biotin carboxyl carrier protein|nr:acetyl-CoA carboxylase biotin carboxyl carrier protein subunit [Candidatus Sulfopaludibacter sp.]
MKLRINVEGCTYDVQVDVLPEGAAVPQELEPELPATLRMPPHPSDSIPDDKICRSPIAGCIVSVSVAPGGRVRRNDPVVTIEAMKMQTAIGAPVSGIIQDVSVKPGDAVKPGQILCRVG